MNMMTTPTDFLKPVNFTASMRDIYDQSGRPVDPAIGRGVYRDDTGELMSVSGPSFKPVQHMDVLNPVLNYLDDNGYSIETRPARRSLYDLQGKKGAWVSVETSNNGAVMRADIITGDFIEITGSTPYLPAGEDTYLYRTSLLNSHNGRFSVTALNSMERVVCANGIVNPAFSAVTRSRHTSGVNENTLREKIAAGVGMLHADPAMLGKLIDTPVGRDQAEVFFRKTIAKLANKPSGEAHWSERMVSTLMRLFDLEPKPCAYALLQAMTAWSTHGEIRSSSNAVTTRFQREARVAAAMRTPEWLSYAA